ncbi:hypothetical protein ACVXG8_09395 [Escherichia coli]
MMDNDRLTLVQPEGAISHHAMQQRGMWRRFHSGGDDVYPGVFLPDQHT